MKIKSTFFDEIEFDEKDMIILEKGLVGMPDLIRFVLMDFSDDSVLHWLQSVDEPNIGFIVSDPTIFDTGYTITIDPEAKKDLKMEKDDEMVVMVIVSVKDKGEKVTGNLQGPLVVNATRHVGCQMILDPDTYGYDTEVPLRQLKEEEESKVGVTA
jgi:flagellar assembly factor FliW